MLAAKDSFKEMFTAASSQSRHEINQGVYQKLMDKENMIYVHNWILFSC